MTTFYSPSTGGFYDEAVHGPRLIKADPTAGERAAGRTRARTIDNPDCLIPADARSLSDKEYQALMDAQESGQMIAVRAGKLVAADRPPPSAEAARVAFRRRRDRLLARTDPMVAVPDYPISAERRDELLAYRRALRDAPAAAEWPTAPDWFGELAD